MYYCLLLAALRCAAVTYTTTRAPAGATVDAPSSLMVLPNIFTKSPLSSSKTKKKGRPDPDDDDHSPDRSPISPPKRKSPTKGFRDWARASRPDLTRSSPSRTSSRTNSVDPSTAPRRAHAIRSHSHFDSNSHPLNLPPDELRRLSAGGMSAMNEPPEPMDLDQDGPISTAPSSPPQVTPGSFPTTNGVNGDASPEPPPHKPARSPSPQRPAVDPEAAKAAGNKHFKAKQYDQAIKEYTKAIEVDPLSSVYLSNRAAAYISANRFAEALEDAKAANELDPENPKVLHRSARVYVSLGRPEEALELYSQLQPPATAKDKAPALAMQHHIKQAEDILREGTTGSMALHALDQAEHGLGAGVDRPRKWKLLRGEAYLKMGNVNALGEAQNVAMSILRSNSKDPEALVLRGRALYGQGENEKAIQHFRQALNCDPDFQDAVKYLRMVQKLDRLKEEGNAAFKAKRYQEAVDVYGKALEVDPLNKGTNSKILQNRAMSSIKV